MKCQLFLIGLLLIGADGCSGKPDGESGQSVSDAGLSLDTVPDSGTSEDQNSSADSSASDWPKWLGPRGDGISRESLRNQDWGTSTPQVVWKRNVGTGFSSVAVVGGRLFTMGHRGGKELVICLNSATGEQEWEASYPGKLVNRMHEGGPCATPTVDRGQVFTLGREGQLHCFQASDGKQIWAKALQIELAVKLPEWGFSCSPLVIGDVLVVEAGRTAAFNRNTGEKIWQTAKYDVGYGSPCVFHHDGDVLIAVLNNDFLLIVRAEDGSEVAKTEWETQYNTSATTPIVQGDQLFISTGYGKGCANFCLDGNTLEKVFENQELRNHMNNCVLWDGFLYGIDGQSSSSRNCTLICMDWNTGEVKWKQRGLGCGSVFIADGKLLVLSDSGQLVLVQPDAQQYVELGRVEALTGKCWTVPVLSGGKIFCRNAAGDLVSLDVAG